MQNLDLTRRKSVHQGNLNLRITNKQKLIELYVLLLEDLIILLQKSHEKYLLQFFPSGGPNERGMCPVIKVSSNIIVRRNAVGECPLFSFIAVLYISNFRYIYTITIRGGGGWWGNVSEQSRRLPRKKFASPLSVGERKGSVCHHLFP